MLGERMIQLEQEIIVIALPVYVQLFGSQAKISLELIDQGEITEDHRVVIRVFTAALAFIVAEKERAVFTDGAAQCKPELVLPQFVEAWGCQFAAGIHRIIAEIVIQRAMEIVGPALSNDIDDPANRASGFHAVGIVNHAELAHCVRGGRGLLHA